MNVQSFKVQNAGITIRSATEADTATILALIRELAEYEKLSHEVVATEEMLRASLFGVRPAAEVILMHCEEQDAPVGFALFFPTLSTFLGRPGLYLEDVYVQPPFRGRGIGRAVFHFLALIAHERNYGRMEWSVLDWNEPAIGFYQKMGAVPMDEWTVYRLTGEPLAALAAD